MKNFSYKEAEYTSNLINMKKVLMIYQMLLPLIKKIP